MPQLHDAPRPVDPRTAVRRFFETIGRNALVDDRAVDAGPQVPALAHLLVAPDPDVLAALLHEGVRFHSPVADYAGRADTSRLLSLIPSILTDVRVCRQLAGDRELTSFLTGRVENRHVDMVVDELYDGSGALVDATLMLRPQSALRRAVELMGRALSPDGPVRREVIR